MCACIITCWVKEAEVMTGRTAACLSQRHVIQTCGQKSRQLRRRIFIYRIQSYSAQRSTMCSLRLIHLWGSLLRLTPVQCQWLHQGHWQESKPNILFWWWGGNRSTQRKPTQTWGEHALSTEKGQGICLHDVSVNSEESLRAKKLNVYFFYLKNKMVVIKWAFFMAWKW